MAFDLEGARQAGYSDAEIASFLAPQKEFDLAGAKKAGYSDAEIVDHLSPPMRSLPAEIGTQAYAGATIDLPKMVGQAMQWFGSDTGKSLTEWATEREKAHPELEPQLEGRSIVGKALSMGSRALAPSVAAMVPAVALAPLGATAAVAGSVAATGALFGGSQAQDTYEKVLAAGGTKDEADTAARINGLIEWGGESVGNYFGLKLLGIGAKAFGGAAAKDVIAGATDTAVVKPFLKQLPKTAAIESATEFGQNAGEGWIEQAYGVKNDVGPLAAGGQGALAALGMTALLAPFGLGGYAIRARQNQRVADALQDPETEPAARIAASKLIYNDLKDVDPKAAEAWSQASAVAISKNLPISLEVQKAPEVVAPPVPPLSEQVSQANDKIAEIAQAETVDEAILKTKEAVDTVDVEGTVKSAAQFALEGRQVLEAMERRVQEEEIARQGREARADEQLAVAQATSPDELQAAPTAMQLAFRAAKERQAAKFPDTPEQAQAMTDEHLQAARDLSRSDGRRQIIDAEIARRQNIASVPPAAPQGAPSQQGILPVETSATPPAAPIAVPSQEGAGPAVAAHQGVQNVTAPLSGPSTGAGDVAPQITILGRPVAELPDKALKVAALKAKAPEARQAAQAEIARRVAVAASERAPQAEGLRRMASESGWDQVGGKIIREHDPGQQRGMLGGSSPVVARTTWIPRHEWFQRMRQDLGSNGLSAPAEIQVAVDRHLAGKPLSPKYQRTVDWMLTEIRDERDNWADAHGVDLEGDATVNDLVDEGVQPTGEALAIAELFAAAEAVNPDEASRIALQYEGDEDLPAAISALKEIVSGQGNVQEAVAGREEGRAAPQGEAGQRPAAQAEEVNGQGPQTETSPVRPQRGEGAGVSRRTGPAEPPVRESPGQRGAGERPALDLQQQTSSEIAAKAAQQAAEAASSAAQSVKDAVDAMRGSFALTGSSRPADEAAARGQQELKPNEPPKRSADTMSEAIALSSPSGHMSKRAKDAATARLSKAMFGEGGLQREATPQPPERERLLAQAKELRELAARGMGKRKNIREAERLEAQARALDKPKFSRAAAPVYYSDLARGIERASMNAAPAKAWLDYLKGLQNKGIKADEIQWSGITDWLVMQEGKVTKQAVVDYLRENGVKVEETVLGGDSTTTANDRIRVQLDALGYSIETDAVDGQILSIMRRSDGEFFTGSRFPDEGMQSFDKLPSSVQELAHSYDANVEDDVEGTTGDRTRYSNYTLPGGENYRELLLTLPAVGTPAMAINGKLIAKYGGLDEAFKKWTPTEKAEFDAAHGATAKEQPEFRSGHFDQPNILAHVRFDERTDAEGKRVLFIEEIQSDWAQKGKREGFISPEVEANRAKARTRMEEIDKELAPILDRYDTKKDHLEFVRGMSSADQDRYADLMKERQENYNKFMFHPSVPPAPFVGKTEAWVSLALKRMIRWAAENGFDRVAWTTGEQQADRYDLSKHIGAILYQEKNDRGGSITAFDPKVRSVVLERDHVSPKDLADLIGKDAADKLMRVESNAKGVRELRGLDLRVGGEGMREFYDKLVPNIANDVLKRLGGGRVSQFEMVTPAKESDPDDEIVVRGGRDSIYRRQPGFDITPAMRERALEGQPQFSRQSRNIDNLKFKQQTDKRGMPIFHNAEIGFARGEDISARNDAGKKLGQASTMRFRIFDTQKRLDGKPIPVGWLVSDVRDGQFLNIRSIQIDNEYRQAGNGYGETTLASMLASNKPNGAIDILDIVVVPEEVAAKGEPLVDARGFWKKMGVEFVNYSNDPSVRMDGYVTQGLYLKARNAKLSRAPENQKRTDTLRPDGERAPARGVETPVAESDAGGPEGGRTGGRGVEQARQVRSELVESFGERGVQALEDSGFLSLIQSTQAPAALREEMNGTEDAAYWNGKAYLFTDKIQTGTAANRLLHELGEHHGLEEMLGRDAYEKLQRQVRNLNKAGNPAVREAWAHVRENYDHAEGSPEFMSEVLARIGDDSRVQKMTFWRQLIDAVRAFLAKLGVDVKSDEDVRTLLRASLARVMRQAERERPVFYGRAATAQASRTEFSRAAHLGTLSADQEAALRNIHGDPVTWKQRLAEFRADWKKNLVQGLFDSYAPILDYSQKGYRLARQAKAGDSTLEALLVYGKVYVDTDGAYKVDYTKKGGLGGFAKVIAALHGEQDRFLEWVAAHRAERLKSIGLENLYSDQDIKALKTLNQGNMKDGKPRGIAYAKALADLNAWNDSVLKIAVDSGLIDDETRQMYKDLPYVPFYRLQDEGTVSGFGMKAGLVNQFAWKKLKGGTEHLNDDLLANLLQNWSHMITASAKNRAAKTTLEAAVFAKVAQEVPSGTPGKGLVHYLDAGKEHVFRVSDPHLLDAISALHYAGLGSVGKPFIAMKRWLTIGVTVNPAFKIRNLIRDSIQAIGTAELSYNPAKNIAQGFKATEKESETRAQLLAGGGMIRFGAMLDGNNADRTRRLIEQGVDPEMILDNASKIERFWKQRMLPAFEAYQELGDRGEQISRAALYEQLTAKGMSHEEAAFWARDLMDFSLSGKWAAVRILTQIVPFMNARLQGIYKLGRATKSDYRRMGTTLAGVALASIGLLLAYGDDEDWKKREDWDRDNYWWFKVGGIAFRIPKPFEVGAVGTLAERSLEYMIDKEMTGKRFRERVAATVFNQLNMNPTPQLVKPLMDIYANKDAFSGRPIETAGMEKLRKQDRYTDRTSEMAKFLGGLGLPDPTQLAMGQWNTLSPVQIDALVRGYFGWLGTSTTTALDWGVRPMMNRGERPDMKLRDVFLAGNFAEALPSGSSRYVTQLYDQAKEIEQAYGSYHDALKRGDQEKAAQILADERESIVKHKAVEQVKRREATLNGAIRMIEASKTLSGEDKRRRIDVLEQRRSDLARQLATR